MASRFIFWSLAPVLFLCGVGLPLMLLPLMLDAWTPPKVMILAAWSGGCFAAIFALYDARRFKWAARTVTAIIFLAYLGYLIDRTRRGDVSPWNSIFPFLVLGLPALWYTIFGRAPLRLTLFDVIALAAAGSGAVLGFQWGYLAWGWPTAVLGAAVGLCVGHVVVQIPGELALWSMMRGLHGSDTPALKRRLQSEYALSHIIVPILKNRGEPGAELQDYTLDLLLSPSPDKRWHGWRTLNMSFPEAAAVLRDINVTSPTEEDHERIRQLLSHAPRPHRA